MDDVKVKINIANCKELKYSHLAFGSEFINTGNFWDDTAEDTKVLLDGMVGKSLTACDGSEFKVIGYVLGYGAGEVQFDLEMTKGDGFAELN